MFLNSIDAALTMAIWNVSTGVMALTDTSSSATGKTTEIQSNVQNILNDATGTINDSGSALNEKVQGMGNVAYNIIFGVVVIILLIVGVMAGAKLALSDASGRQEAKAKILWVVAGAGIVFGAAGLLYLIAGFASSLVSTSTTEGGLIVPALFMMY